jgi:hypothetical protein
MLCKKITNVFTKTLPTILLFLVLTPICSVFVVCISVFSFFCMLAATIINCGWSIIKKDKKELIDVCWFDFELYLTPAITFFYFALFLFVIIPCTLYFIV